MTEVQAGWVGGKVAKREAMARRAPARQREAREDGEEARMRRARDALCRHSGVVQVEVRDTRRGTAPAGGGEPREDIGWCSIGRGTGRSRTCGGGKPSGENIWGGDTGRSRTCSSEKPHEDVVWGSMGCGVI